jgi:3-hydroxybutyryl-CoA dehydrogenase
MGAGIAQLCLQRGFQVILYDSAPEALRSAAGKIRQGLENAVAKNRISQETLELALKNGVCAKSLKELETSDLVIEAVSENLEVKGALFKEISALLPSAVIATNTSSLSVSSVAEFARSPERVLGIHFFNPPVATKLIEMVKAPKTSDGAYQAAWDFVKAGLGRTPIAVKDTPGFVVNRVMRPYYLESQRAVLCGAGISELDIAARETGGVPMGPFELMDLIGLDINLAITKTIYEALNRPERFKPQPIQEHLVSLGYNGRKSGKGFYLYEGEKRVGENPEVAVAAPGLSDLSDGEAWEMVIQAVIKEAEMALKEGIASREDIDLAITLAMNFPRGPFSWKNKSDL